MIKRYVAFDVETPNHENNRMCALGVTVVDDGEIVRRFSTLIDPGTYFDPFNMQLCGIRPQDTARAPGFSELWEKIGPLFCGGATLAAHNAPFDMAVLAKCLSAYRIPCPRVLPYVCTCRLARKAFPDFPNHKLDTVCRMLSIDLDHHKAGSDSYACAEILCTLLRRGMPIEEHIREYDLLDMRTRTARNSKF